MPEAKPVSNQHISVLIEPILDFTHKKGVVFEGTLGGGGYTSKLLAQNHIIYSCDADYDAINTGNQNFQSAISSGQLHLLQGHFIDKIEEFENSYFDYIILDLGYSSNQLEFSQRGFSYQKGDQDLDLRYDYLNDEPAWQKIYDLEEAYQLQKIIYNFSGESFSKIISIAIFELALETKKSQGQIPLKVSEIVYAVESVLPPKIRHKSKQILSRVWQALRIWTNGELEELEQFLPISLDKLNTGGKLIIVSFHSLEDKLITKFMRQASKPVEIDDFGNKAQYFKLLTKHPIEPTEQEVQANIRSRSGKLRILERL
jgi:16S rRNA (cytosine1402-N4)-methyltransferase